HPLSTPKRTLCVVPGTVGDASCLHGAPTCERREVRQDGEVSGLREGPCGAPERAGIAPRRTFRLGRATCAAIPSRARGRRFQRAARGALKSNRALPRTVPEPRDRRLAAPYRAITARGIGGTRGSVADRPAGAVVHPLSQVLPRLEMRHVLARERD